MSSASTENLRERFEEVLQQSFTQGDNVVSFKSAMENECLKEGFLEISELSNPQFALRYFRLQPPALYYFLGKEDEWKSSEAEGVLNLTNASLTPSKNKKKLVLTTKKKYTVMLRATDEHLLREWSDALVAAGVSIDDLSASDDGRQSPNLRKLARKSISGVKRASVSAMFGRRKSSVDMASLPEASSKAARQVGTLKMMVTSAMFESNSDNAFLLETRHMLLTFHVFSSVQELFDIVKNLWCSWKQRAERASSASCDEMTKKFRDRLFVFFRLWMETFLCDFESTFRTTVMEFAASELGEERTKFLKGLFLQKEVASRGQRIGSVDDHTPSRSDAQLLRLLKGEGDPATGEAEEGAAQVVTSRSTSATRRKAPRKGRANSSAARQAAVAAVAAVETKELAVEEVAPAAETTAVLDDIFAMLEDVPQECASGEEASRVPEASSADCLTESDMELEAILGRSNSIDVHSEDGANENGGHQRTDSVDLIGQDVPDEVLLQLPAEHVLAEQLTLMDLHFITEITLPEFLPISNGVEEDQLHIEAPRLYSYILHSEHVSMWVVETVFKSSNPKTQVSVIRYFAKVMKKCYAMKSYSTACEILRGLQHQDVQEHPLYNVLSSSVRGDIERLSELFLDESEYKGYHDSVDTSGLWVPCIQAYTSRLSGLATLDYWVSKDDNMLNFVKIQSVGEIVYATGLHHGEGLRFTIEEDRAITDLVRSQIMDAVVANADRREREAERVREREEALQREEEQRARYQQMLRQKKTEEVVVEFVLPVVIRVRTGEEGVESKSCIERDRNFGKAPEKVLPNGAAANVVSLIASSKKKVTEIKSELLDLGREFLSKKHSTYSIAEPLDFDCLLGKEDDYGLKVLGIDEYIVNETLPLHRVDFLQVCAKAYVKPKLAMVPRSMLPKEVEGQARKMRMVKELGVGTEISELVGNEQLRTYLECENPEITYFRRQGAKYKHECDIEQASHHLDSSEDNAIPYLPQYLLNEPLPMVVPDNVSFMCIFPSPDMNNKVPCSPLKTANEVRDIAFRRYARALGPEASKGLDAKDYLLKVTGTSEYLDGKNQFIAFDYVRRALSKNEQMRFSLVLRDPVREALEKQQETYNSMVNDLIAFEPPYFGRDHSIFNIKVPLEITVRSAHCNKGADESPWDLFITAEVYHGGHLIASAQTPTVSDETTAKWNHKVVFPRFLMCNIPKGSRVCITLYRAADGTAEAGANGAADCGGGEVDVDSDATALGWCALQLISHTGHVQHGVQMCPLWMDEKADPIGTCSLNRVDMDPHRVVLEFHGMPRGRPVVYPSTDGEPSSRMQPIDERNKLLLDEIVALDPLTDMTTEQKTILWQYRHHVQDKPAALAKLLMAVKWDNHKHVIEAHKMLAAWARPNPMQALELLDAKFSDPVVRDYGVECLRYMAPGECADFMLQLTQVLKHEPYHHSALAKFLLQRAWSDSTIGHTFYWFLKAEMHIPMVAERYTILLETYLRGAPTHRKQLIRQAAVMNSLVVVANKIKTLSASVRLDSLRSMLRKLKFPDDFQLPLDQRMVASNLLVEKCKYMDSKKLPLWLVWKNADPLGKPIFTIFKVGDDLRQDALTLQMIKIMDKLWKNEGLDLLLHPYGCIATGDEIGMIEVVLNSETTANINKAAGGTKAVFQKETLRKWIKKHNPSKSEWAQAQTNFMKSCAGYCVATYVLGIGDRHNDNIMVTKQGHLFHIDFGHFLGNFKEKFGFKRERAPFVFTPQYAAVLGGPKTQLFQGFLETSCRAYNILRKHSPMFINLFQMMLCTGIPELRSTQDMEYLRTAFSIGVGDDEAARRFTQLVYDSLATRTTVLNDAIHVFVHSDKKKKKDKKKKDQSG